MMEAVAMIGCGDGISIDEKSSVGVWDSPVGGGSYNIGGGTKCDETWV